ncbi:NPCBM/NEW2 domain-containing protein [Actinoplanes sp. CA-142083]|uniref:NPCBM/NEW2 domain-containing protein n=1 Tax=Actinoplanes sp. CA-142083 TaxID=3239903 RepID=UPI003D8A7BF9
MLHAEDNPISQAVSAWSPVDIRLHGDRPSQCGRHFNRLWTYDHDFSVGRMTPAPKALTLGDMKGGRGMLVWYVALGIIMALTAWLVNRLTHHSWFTTPRTIALILVTIIAAAFMQNRISTGTSAKGSEVSPRPESSEGSSAVHAPGSPKTTSPAKPAMVTRTLASSDSSGSLDDANSIPYFAGYVESNSPQDVNGDSFAQNLNFPLVCSDTSDKFVDYNLGRDYETFTATIGPSDISKSKRYSFEVWVDSERVFSKSLSHGQSKKLNLSVHNGLKLRLAACSLDETVIMEREGGGIFGDPQVHGYADKVPGGR